MLEAELRPLAALGRVDEVQALLDESLSLPIEDDVTPANLMASVAAELRAHGYREASSQVADRTIGWLLAHPSRGAESRSQRFALALAYYEGGRWEEARTLLQELYSETPDDLDVQGYLGTLAAHTGNTGEALAISASLNGLAAPRDFGGVPYREARIAALLGDRERAVALLQDAFARGREFTIFLHRDRDLESLSGYPPFEELLRPKG